MSNKPTRHLPGNQLPLLILIIIKIHTTTVLSLHPHTTVYYLSRVEAGSTRIEGENKAMLGVVFPYGFFLAGAQDNVGTGEVVASFA